MLQIKITPLKPGTHHFELEPTPEDLDLDPALFENVKVDAQLDLHSERILVRLKARADATLECDRTLVLFKHPLRGEHTVLFASPEIAEAAAEAKLEDIRVLHPGDQEIDITEAVRDTILLAIPVRKIAPGAEEQEIPTAFGEPSGDGAIDPRWEALKKLKAETEE